MGSGFDGLGNAAEEGFQVGESVFEQRNGITNGTDGAGADGCYIGIGYGLFFDFRLQPFQLVSIK